MKLNLESYIKAGYSILYILTSEESRAELLLLETSQNLKRSIKFWSHTEGFVTPSDDPRQQKVERKEDPIEALNYAKSDLSTNIFVMKDLHMFLTIPKTIRLLRDIARDFKQTKKTMIIISPVKKIPAELERDVTVIEFDLPKKEDLKVVFDNLYEGSKNKIGQISEDEIERIVQASMGLTTIEAENSFAKAIVENAGDKSLTISKRVMVEKANTVKKTGILEYFETAQTINDIGGLDNLKDWLKLRSKAFSKEARDFGLPLPKGILLVGLPGAGKSLTAKAASNILGVPLIKFDVGKVFGGLVGESESNMRTAIQTAEAVGNSVLWIDEMEKAFAGMGGSGTTDGGTSQRVFGSFITWMQEKKSPVFIIATVNRIDNLPSELLRKGRFDEIFFVGLPSEKEREDIIKIHIKKYGRDISKFKSLKDCVKESEGFTGAELEEAVISGLYSAFDDGRELTSQDILNSIKNTNPISKTREKDLSEMIDWATKNAINASKVKDNKLSAGRQISF